MGLGVGEGGSHWLPLPIQTRKGNDAQEQRWSVGRQRRSHGTFLEEVALCRRRAVIVFENQAVQVW
jgi:hypothetical protein